MYMFKITHLIFGASKFGPTYTPEELASLNQCMEPIDGFNVHKLSYTSINMYKANPIWVNREMMEIKVK